MKHAITILTIILTSGTGALAAFKINAGDYDRGEATKPRPDDSAIVINGWVEYDIEVEKTGYYTLSVEHRHRGSQPITLKLDGERITSKLCEKGAGSETPWKSPEMFHFYLRQGNRVLRLEADRSPELRRLLFTTRPGGFRTKWSDTVPTAARRMAYVSMLIEDAQAALDRLDPTSDVEPLAGNLKSLEAGASSLDTGKMESFAMIEGLRDEVAQLRWELTSLRFKQPPQAGKQVAVWVSNPLVKVFQDDPLPGKADLAGGSIEACRNEYEPIQLCITSCDYDGPVRVEVSPLVHRSGRHSIGDVDARFVGYVPLHQQGDTTHIRGMELPAMWPDPLILDEQVTLGPRQTQPVWITVKVPKDALPGDYHGDITVITEGGRVSTPVNLKVYPMVIPDETNFWLGGWAGENRQSSKLGLDPFTPEFFEFLKDTLVNRFDHRARTYSDEPSWNALGLVKVTWTGSGYTYDYTLWDKYISLVEQTYRGQFRVICVSFGARRVGEKGLVFRARVYNPDGSINAEKSFRDVFPDAPGYLDFIEDFFVNMQEHLREKGWLDNVYFKVMDEVNHGKAVDHFRIVGRHMKKVAPDIRQDATIGVPQMFEEDYIDLPIGGAGLGHNFFFEKEAELFAKEAAKGREVWFYSGIGDIDDPDLIEVRGVGWLGYRFGLKGYHRWAYAWITNAWENADFTTPARSKPEFVRAGRDFLVYVDEKNRRIIDSIRWEMFRETAEDYELLLLAEKAGLDSNAFCRQIVKAADNVESDPDQFYEVRRQLLTGLGGVAKK